MKILKIKKIIKFFKKFKPIKYMSLLIKYNSLENEYNSLKNMVSNKLFDEMLSKIITPEEIQKKDRRIKQLEKQIKELK